MGVLVEMSPIDHGLTVGAAIESGRKALTLREGMHMVRSAGTRLIYLPTLLTLCCAVPERSPDAGNAPTWVRTAQPISSSDIPQTDYPYLAEWIEANSGPCGGVLPGTV